MGVQALLAQPSIKRFHEGVMGGLAGPTEDEDDAAFVGPLIECVGGEFWTILSITVSTIENDLIWALEKSKSGQ